ncbi:MAG TPA: hypothetical protein VJL29_06450 [Thermoguttaceae bacterium]|nr:hypothetical protein [Thermoguttaceae bacterium]
MRFRFLLAAVALALVVPASWAGPLDVRQISADARWVAHLDVDALRTTQAAEQYLKPLLAKERAQAGLQKLREAGGFDLAADLHGVTLYGTRFEPRRGVVIFHADAVETRLVAFLETQPDYKTTEYGRHAVHSWTDRHSGSHTVIGCLYRPGKSSDESVQEPLLVLIAHNPSDMRRAIDVVDGKAASLDGDDSPLVAGAEQRASKKPVVVMLGAGGLAEAALPLKSPVLRQCDMLNVVLGETDGEAFLACRLAAKSDEGAKNIEQVVQGLLAMGRLAGDANENLKKVLETVELSLDGKTVELRWHGQAADVVHAARTQWALRHGGGR